MSLKTILTTGIISIGIALCAAAPQSAEARSRHKVVYKHKRIHHRHKVGLRHIGRGTRTVTKVKTDH